MRINILLLATLVGVLAAGEARPLIHPLFADHAVLQRDRPLPVWGWDAPGTKLMVTLGKVQAEAVAGADGRWQVTLPAQPAGGPVELTVAGTRTEKRSDILLGEVWLCSGQSNMGWTLGKTTGGPAAAVDDPELRLCSIGKRVSLTPQALPASVEWKGSTPASAAEFSAVAYYFGRELRTALKVPVGLLHASWGGTVGEAWCSRAAVQTVARYTAGLPAADGTAAPDKKFGPQGQNRPTGLYNGMIHPLAPYGLRGAIWYQGESNGYMDQAPDYRRLLTSLIADWRGAFANPELAFGIVQLSGWKEKQKSPVDGGWAWIRESQALVAREVPHCGLALAIDLGDVVDPHFLNKKPIGERLGRWARATIHGEKGLEWSGPWYRSVAVEKGALRLSFEHAEGMRAAEGGKITGFAIAGADKKWRYAEATVEGAAIILRSPEVAEPVAARYAWAMHPVCNLVNAVGIPAVPFRTDDWSN